MNEPQKEGNNDKGEVELPSNASGVRPDASGIHATLGVPVDTEPPD